VFYLTTLSAGKII